MHYTPTEREILELLNKPAPETLKGIRDRALLELLYASALRRKEASRLDITHINLKERTLRA